jgi:hypothetical protein
VRPTCATPPPAPKPAAVERVIPPLRPSPTDFRAPRAATNCQRTASETVSARSSGVDARSGALVASTGAQPLGTSTATAAGGQSERSPAVSPTGAPPVKTNKRNRFDDTPAAAQSAPVKGKAVVEEVLLPLPGAMQGTVASNSGSQQPLSLPNRPKQNMQHSGYGSSQVLLKESGPTSLPNGVHTISSGPHHEHSAHSGATPRSPRRRSFEPGELATLASESVSLPGRNRGGTKRAHENGTVESTAQSPAAKRNRFAERQVDLSAAAPAPKLDRFGQPRVNATNARASLQHSTVSALRDVPTSTASVVNAAADKSQPGNILTARKQAPVAFGGTGVPVGATNSALDRSDQRIQSRRGDREYGALPAHSAAAVKRNVDGKDASSVQSEGASSSAFTARNTYRADGRPAVGRAVSARLSEYGGLPMSGDGDQWRHDHYSASSDSRPSHGQNGGRGQPPHLQTWDAAQRSDRYDQTPAPRGPPPYSSAAPRNSRNDGQYSTRGNPHRDSHSAKTADPSGRADDRSSRSSRSLTRNGSERPPRSYSNNSWNRWSDGNRDNQRPVSASNNRHSLPQQLSQARPHNQHTQQPQAPPQPRGRPPNTITQAFVDDFVGGEK